jgi:7-cyano-7-deazaguanine synthase in queuosine biosynthesis
LPLVHGKISRADKIGVYLSGGLDSAVLLCLILTELKNTGNLHVPIYCFTINKNDHSVYHAQKVISEVEKRFNVVLPHVVDVPNDPDAIMMGNIGPTAIKFVETYVPNMITYMAINHAPPKELVVFAHTLNVKYPTAKNNSYPFLFLHKPNIIDLAYKLDCEWILPNTHSCSVLKDVACGNCYACEERAWGFSMLGKTDPLDSKIITINSNV